MAAAPRLAAPERTPVGAARDLAAPINQLHGAMLAHPKMVTGDGNLDTDIMRLSEGRVAAKLGAEGLPFLAIPEPGLGIASADESGSPRGLGPAAVAILEHFGHADPETLAALRERRSGAVATFIGATASEIRPALRLRWRQVAPGRPSIPPPRDTPVLACYGPGGRGATVVHRPPGTRPREMAKLVECVGRLGYVGGYRVVAGEERIGVVKDGATVVEPPVRPLAGMSIGRFVEEAARCALAGGASDG